MTTYKYFTKASLIQAARAGNERGYNRQLDPDKLQDLQWEKWLPVGFSMLHEHINGEPVEPHMRVMVTIGPDGEQVMLDVSMECYNGLPEVDPEVPSMETDGQLDGQQRITK